MRFVIILVILLAAAICPVAAQPDTAAGARTYAVCAGCHGFYGEGNQLVAAPRLAGLETWYLERQMRDFASERRGHLEADINGQRMALMAQAVDSDRELEDLLAWIGTLPAPSEQAETVAAQDNATGQALYGLCSACHGAEGQGNESLNAPALTTLDGWYFSEQLRLYAEGLRGTHPADIYGAQMRALAASFDTEEERQALASFVTALRPR